MMDCAIWVVSRPLAGWFPRGLHVEAVTVLSMRISSAFQLVSTLKVVAKCWLPVKFVGWNFGWQSLGKVYFKHFWRLQIFICLLSYSPLTAPLTSLCPIFLGCLVPSSLTPPTPPHPTPPKDMQRPRGDQTMPFPYHWNWIRFPQHIWLWIMRQTYPLPVYKMVLK